MTLPYTIQAIVDQAGGMGMSGAFVYMGARQYTYTCPQQYGECRAGYQSCIKEQGDGSYTVKFGVGLRFQVNGKRGAGWYMVVAYEPNDTYTVWLVENRNNRNPANMVITQTQDVYCMELKTVMEQVYDEAINQHCNGVIPY